MSVGAPELVQVSMPETPVLELLSDAEVMLRVAAGDDGAFDYLVEKFRRPMVSFMYRMTRNQGIAEELAQEEEDAANDYCGVCNGSGEGRYDGSRCWACKGKGVPQHNREEED